MKNIFVLFTAAIALLLSTYLAVNAQPILDNTFSGDGYLLASPGGNDYARAVLVQSNGRILTGGNTYDAGTYYDIHIIRTKPNGAIDNSFGTAGITKIPGGFLCDMALLPGGKIIVAGNGEGPTGHKNFTVYRLTKNGAIDNTFGTGGSVAVNIPNINMVCFDVVLQPDKKILLAGYIDDGSWGHHNMIIVRLKANGNPDSTFATNGMFTFLQNNKSSECNQLALQPDGKIVAAGCIDTLNSVAVFEYDFAALRLNANGTLDNTFGEGGVVRADKGDTEIAYAVSVLSDERIVLGGSTDYFGNARFAALCLLPNGSIDTLFGTDGWSFSDFYGGNAGCYAMVAEPDDDIIMGGLVYINAGSAIAITKLLSNGSPDNTFGNNGIDTSFYGTAGKACSDIALQSDNKIVITGFFYAPGTKRSFLIARYTNSATFMKPAAVASDFDVNIYPNPTSGAFVVALSNPLNENTTITITNLLGQVVYADKLTSLGNQMSLPIALSTDLPDGIYFVNIISGEQMVTKQFVKQE
ncbi:MAG: T9SS type A sorting domain-containing protein [Chitinophagales bacterium]|nr:T9SS type A sorting domain-containing protein [Chitinophagales bacterium]